MQIVVCVEGTALAEVWLSNSAPMQPECCLGQCCHKLAGSFLLELCGKTYFLGMPPLNPDLVMPHTMGSLDEQNLEPLKDSGPYSWGLGQLKLPCTRSCFES